MPLTTMTTSGFTLTTITAVKMHYIKSHEREYEEKRRVELYNEDTTSKSSVLRDIRHKKKAVGGPPTPREPCEEESRRRYSYRERVFVASFHRCNIETTSAAVVLLLRELMRRAQAGLSSLKVPCHGHFY